MRRFTQLICLILILSTVIYTPVLAVEAANPKASNYFMKHGTYLEKISSTEFEVWFDVTAVSTMLEVGVKTIKVQKSSDGDDWETVKTYSKDDYAQMTDTNTAGHADCVTYDEAEKGYYYRAIVTFYARNSSGRGEYDDATSSIRM